MTEPPTTSPQKRRSLKRIAGLIGAVFLLLAIILYFASTTNFFLQKVVLPRVSKALGAQVTAHTGSLHPFSSVSLSGVTVKKDGQPPLLRADKVRAHYHFLSLIRGKIKIDQVTVQAPILEIVREDPTRKRDEDQANLPKKSGKKPGAARPQPRKTTEPPEINIGQFKVDNATIRLISHNDRESVVTELSKFNLSLEHVGQNQNGQLQISGLAKQQTTPSGPEGSNGLAEAIISGKFGFTLNASLQPAELKGSAEIEITKAEGKLTELASTKIVVRADVTPAEVREIALVFHKGAQSLGQARLTGPFDFASNEGRLTLEIFSIDRQVLNLVGAPRGWDFKNSLLNSTNQFTIAKKGARFAALGDLTLTQLSLARSAPQSPPVDLICRYEFGWDRDTQLLDLKKADLRGTQGDQELLRATLDHPMTLSFTQKNPATNDAAFRVAVRKLNVEDWGVFFGSKLQKGRLDLDMKLETRQGGKQIQMDFEGQGSELAGWLGANKFSAPSVTAAGTIGYARQDRSELMTELNLNNLVLIGTNGQRGRPLTMRLNVSGARKGDQIDLREALLTLPGAAARGSNQLQITGTLDLATNRAAPSRLAITSESFDISLLSGFYPPTAKGAKGSKPRSARSKGAKAPKAEPEPTPEPEPVSLPLRQLDLDIAIKQLGMQELVINNLAVQADLKESKLRIKPFSLLVNGAPVKGELNANLGIAGYQYNARLSGEKVPLDPLVKIFSPENAGRYKGNLDLNTELRGKGITAKNLRKNLEGHIHAGFTNADIQVLAPKIQSLLVPIATVLRVPELTETPIHWLTLEAAIDNGKINLKELTVAAEAFHAHSQGVVALAGQFPKSQLNLPVSFSLKRSLAQKSGLATPSNGHDPYVKLPDFLRLAGTLADPKTKLDNTAVAGLLIQSAGRLEVGGEKASSILGEIGAVLGKNKNPQSQTNRPNQSSTNSVLPNILDLIRKK